MNGLAWFAVLAGAVLSIPASVAVHATIVSRFSATTVDKLTEADLDQDVVDMRFELICGVAR